MNLNPDFLWWLQHWREHSSLELAANKISFVKSFLFYPSFALQFFKDFSVEKKIFASHWKCCYEKPQIRGQYLKEIISLCHRRKTLPRFPKKGQIEHDTLFNLAKKCAFKKAFVWGHPTYGYLSMYLSQISTPQKVIVLSSLSGCF